MNKRKPTPPRNHVVVAMLKRKAGAGVHGKTGKVQRRQDKVALKRACNSAGSEYRTFPRVVSSNLTAPTINQSAFKQSVF